MRVANKQEFALSSQDQTTCEAIIAQVTHGQGASPLTKHMYSKQMYMYVQYLIVVCKHKRKLA